MRPLVMALVVLVYLAAPAGASTVSVSPLLGRPDDALVYAAGPGEANRVAIQAEAGTNTFLVADPGAAIAAGDSCVPVDAHAARCGPRSGPDGRARPIVVARIDAGDGADELRWMGDARLDGARVLGGEGDDALAAPPSQSGSLVYGGPGDDRLGGAAVDDELYGEDGDDQLIAGLSDRLSGGRGDDHLTGSRGDDDMDGGEGADVVRGLGGADELLDSEKAPTRDVLDGGRGRDRVSYRRRRRGVRVDLARGRGGEPSEGDVLVSIRDVVGGRGDDVLAGDSRGNRIIGNGGADRLLGRSGGDELTIDSGRETLSCGARTDRVFGEPVAGVRILSDCELFGRYVATPSPYPFRSGGGALRYRVTCPVLYYDTGDDDYPCSVRLTIREAVAPHRVLAAGRLPFRRGQRRVLTATLTPLGRRRGGSWATVMIRRRSSAPRGERPMRADFTIRLPG
jgi:Ca2+-binding RTX toxin-like protein